MAVNNLVNIQYAQTGRSSATNDMGMREMQAMVYEQRNRKHLLVKAPPASGLRTTQSQASVGEGPACIWKKPCHDVCGS